MLRNVYNLIDFKNIRLHQLFQLFFNPQQNDQGWIGPLCFKRLMLLKVITVKKYKNYFYGPVQPYALHVFHFIIVYHFLIVLKCFKKYYQSRKWAKDFTRTSVIWKCRNFKLVPNGQTDLQKNCEFQKIISYSNSRLRMLTFFSKCS